jgi:transcriptional regulator with PAS, ATPase and Fis domain
MITMEDANETADEHEAKKGGFRHVALGALVERDPEKAAEKIRNAWNKEGSANRAAKRLDLSPATFWRYVDRLETAGYMAKPRDAQGNTPQRGGKPGGKKRRAA